MLNNDLPGNSNNSNDLDYTNGNYFQTYTTALSGGGAVNEQWLSDSWAYDDVAQMTQTWALTRIYITVAAGYTGTEYFVWNTNGIAKDPLAPFYGLPTNYYPPLDPNLIGGSITVVPELVPALPIVPEPCSLLLMALGAIGLSAFGAGRAPRHGNRAL